MALMGYGTFNSSKIYFVLVTSLIEYRKELANDLQTYLNNSFQLFADTFMSKCEGLTTTVVEKVPPEARLKGRDLGMVENLMTREQALNRH